MISDLSLGKSIICKQKVSSRFLFIYIISFLFTRERAAHWPYLIYKQSTHRKNTHTHTLRERERDREMEEEVKHILLAKFKQGISEDQIEEYIKQYANLVNLVPSIKAFKWYTMLSSHFSSSTFDFPYQLDCKIILLKLPQSTKYFYYQGFCSILTLLISAYWYRIGVEKLNVWLA